MTSGPLSGLQILEFAGIGPGPYCGQLLADLGAEVTVVDRPKRGAIALEHTVDRRGKRSIVIDLKNPDGVKTALALISNSDALIEGNRPGVMERLGLGPDIIHTANPALVYGRMTGWGQTGPYAQMAGHDINYLAITGALQAMGPKDKPPFPPLNLVGDFGGGSLFLAMGMLAALLDAEKSGVGRVVDAAITDGVNSMMGFFHGLHSAGRWTDQRGENWLDGGAPYYRCYETTDGKFMAVGCIEPQFFAAMLNGLVIDATDFGAQQDQALHAQQSATLTAKFLTKTQAEWAAIFDGTDACVSPVLSYLEAAQHPHILARTGLTEVDGLTHPAVAPVIGQQTAVPNTRIAQDGDATRVVLREAGLTEAQIEILEKAGVVRQL